MKDNPERSVGTPNPPSHEEAVEAACNILKASNAGVLVGSDILLQHWAVTVTRALLSREMLRSDDVPRKGSGETEATPPAALAISVKYVEEEYASLFGKRCSTEQARRLVGVALQGIEDHADWKEQT